MAARRTTRNGTARWQKVTALLPMALLAGAWTASLGSATTAIADPGQDTGLPAVPTTAFNSPASYTDAPALDPSMFDSNSHGANSSADATTESVNGIPTAAMLAYQQAESVLDQADPSCRISWALIAAIGRVESDHGRHAGSVLTSSGKSRPAIYGPALDGSNGTALIRDTDNGAYDNDRRYDRAVGPMQFIPGTWAIVGVDGDGDGIRDPQDIDDAALAAGVYLCAGPGDLSTTADQRTAVFSYNHSQEYVDLVLAIMAAYLDGDYTTVADGLPITSYLRPSSALTQSTGPHSTNDSDNSGRPGSSGHQQSGKNTASGKQQSPRPGGQLPQASQAPPGSQPPPPPSPSNNPQPATDEPPRPNRPSPPTDSPGTNDPTPPKKSPSPNDPTPPKKSPSPNDPTPPKKSPSPNDPTPPKESPSPNDPTPNDPTPNDPTPPKESPSPPKESPQPPKESPQPPKPKPKPEPKPDPTPLPPVPTTTVTQPVQPIVDPVAKATAACQAAFADADYNPTAGELDQCVAAYQEGGMAAVDALIATLTAVPGGSTPTVPTPSVPTLPAPTPSVPTLSAPTLSGPTLSGPTPSVGVPTP